MAALATAAYGVGPQPHAAVNAGRPTHQPPTEEEQFIATFFCRALYDYQAQDASALSFRRNDIIEVLTPLESGWWDGLLGDERGWFPSNYVTIITDQEAESALSGSESSAPQSSSEADDSLVDMAHSLSRGQSRSELEWLDGEMEYPSSSRNALEELAHATMGGGTQSNDFWVPQVTPDGQIYYVNTKTGQHSRDLPQETEDVISEADLAALTSSSSPSTGAGKGVPGKTGDDQDNMRQAGFGVIRRSGTPEPWVRRLADDGMSYYYWNKLNGQWRWTLPESDATASDQESAPNKSVSENGARNRDTVVALNRTRSDSSASQTHMSVYSDDSDIQPLEREASLPSTSQHSSNGYSRGNIRQASSGSRSQEQNGVVELTSADRLAQSLQQALAPPPPESVTDLSSTAREAIVAVTECAQLIDELTRRPEQDELMDQRVLGVVLAIRSLLYVSAPQSSHIPTNVLPPDARDYKSNPASQTLQAHLKPSQRKVTATLSKLVLSTRAMQYDSGSSTNDTPNRIESDAAELERAVVAFVLEVQRYHNQIATQDRQAKLPSKRLHGVFMTNNIGLGLVGAGTAGNWKGFGWVSGDQSEDQPTRVLGTEVIAGTRVYQLRIGEQLTSLMQLLRDLGDLAAEQVVSRCRDIIAHLSSFLVFLADISVKRHVDVQGVNRDRIVGAHEDSYLQSVEKARLLARTLEAATQSLFDDGSMLLLSSQRPFGSEKEQPIDFDYLDALGTSLTANLSMVQQTLEALLSVGHDQADLGEDVYQQSIEGGIYRFGVETNFSGDLHSLSDTFLDDSEGDDIVDTELAFKPRTKMQSRPNTGQDSSGAYRKASQSSETTLATSESYRSNSNSDLPSTPVWPNHDISIDTLVGPSSPGVQPTSALEDDASVFEDDVPIVSSSKSPLRPDKLTKVLGPDVPQHYVNNRNNDSKPWYLRPSYDPNEIIIEPDGAVRAGTVFALVERLTAHEHGDPGFIGFTKTFLMTYKSFTNLDELFELLVKRFWIQPPEELNAREREEWTKLKQNVIRIRVLNAFKSMVITDEGFLEKEDLYILERIKGFVSSEQVIQYPAAKQLLMNIERVQRGDLMIKTTNSLGSVPPAPIVPKTNKKLKVLDIDPLELARQLTILESQLFLRIRPTECLQRSKKSGEHADNISTFIQTFNRIASWVKDSVLSKEDSRKRAAVVKHFINVAERCRTLHNFSSMAAIVSGLNASPINRLKRTWEQVGARFMTQLAACHIDTNKNYTAYRSTLAKVTPPCVPFFGTYLGDLTFIGDGFPDTVNGNLVNFRKRHKVAEVIQEIKRWQSRPYNFHPVAAVLAYIEEGLNQFADQVDYDEQFWQLSLEREPREREDEKMARLLQESGFL